jgi:hypothetical protein
VMTQRKRGDDESGRNRRTPAWKCSKSNSARIHFFVRRPNRTSAAKLEATAPQEAGIPRPTTPSRRLNALRTYQAFYVARDEKLP